MKVDAIILTLLLTLAYVAGVLWQLPFPQQRNALMMQTQVLNQATRFFAWLATSDAASWSLFFVGAGTFIAALKILKLNREQTNAAIVAANAARDAADVARETLRLGERAWLSVDNFAAGFDNGQPLRVAYKVMNTGGTPAHVTGSKANVIVAETVPAAPMLNRPLTVHTISIAAGKNGRFVHHSTPPIVVNQDLLDEIACRKKTLFFYGHVEYMDVFGSQHATGWGAQWDAQLQAFTPIESQTYNYAS